MKAPMAGLGRLAGWWLALPVAVQAANESTPASAIQVREGFRVERLGSQNSWVAMGFDPARLRLPSSS